MKVTFKIVAKFEVRDSEEMANVGECVREAIEKMTEQGEAVEEIVEEVVGE